jgi:hypothetical protein
MKKMTRILLLLTGFAILSSCELLNPKPTKTQYLVSINEIIKYPRASRIEKEVPTITGENIWVSTTPFLSSSAIVKIEAIPIKDRENFCDLKLKLSRRGSLVWMQLSAERAFRQLAFLVDGVFFRKIVPEHLTTEKDEYVILKVGLDNVTAQAIADASEKNYRFFNPDADETDPF